MHSFIEKSYGTGWCLDGWVVVWWGLGLVNFSLPPFQTEGADLWLLPVHHTAGGGPHGPGGQTGGHGGVSRLRLLPHRGPGGRCGVLWREWYIVIMHCWFCLPWTSRCVTILHLTEICADCDAWGAEMVCCDCGPQRYWGLWTFLWCLLIINVC